MERVFKKLTAEQVRVLDNIEGGLGGNRQLAKIIDDALDVALSELPANIPQANVVNLVADLAAKLTASQAAAVADLGALAAVGSTDGSGGAGDAALAADVDARFLAVQGKIDALLGALRTAAIIDT